MSDEKKFQNKFVTLAGVWEHAETRDGNAGSPEMRMRGKYNGNEPLVIQPGTQIWVFQSHSKQTGEAGKQPPTHYVKLRVANEG